jgi:drug/metabolite transporter (DMT)-like permease
MLKWMLIICTVFASSAGDILCAKAMSEGREIGDLHPTGLLRAIEYIVTRRLVILGYVCYAAAFISLMGLFSVAELTVAVPATALSFVIDTLGAHFILHEHIPWKRWIGVVCVSAGVLLAVRPGASRSSTGAARSKCVTVQACQDQSRHNQPSTKHLHH